MYKRKAVKKQKDIACLGPEGTFSYIVAEKIFPQERYLTQKTIGQIFASVKSKKADFGIVPVENTVAGIVQETIDHLFINGVKVVGSYKMPIHHYLLARTKDKKPIKLIRSHNQALNQCKEWLAKNFPEAELSSESSSVEAILSDFNPNTAFIGSRDAAKKYKLKILAKNIEDYTHNFTEFYVISRKYNKSPSKNIKSKNSILIVTVKDRPGVLRDILNEFADRQLNLAKLHSRFNIFKGKDYYFFLEVECLPVIPRFKQALKGIRKYCSSVNLVGTV